MKKAILILILCSMLLGLFACGGNNESETGKQTESERQTESTHMTESESATEAKTTESYVKPTAIVDVGEAFSFETIDFEYGEEQYTLPYRMYLPEGYSSDCEYPVLLFLHGAGERGKDNELQLKNVIQNLFNDLDSPIYGAIVLCPQCMEDMRWVESDWSIGTFSIEKLEISVPMSGVFAMMEDVMGAYSVDEDRVYLMGLSMGGYGTWYMLETSPDLFAGAVAMCSGGDPEYAVSIKDTPILVVHGDADGTVPVAGSRTMVDALRNAGSTVFHYQEMPGYSHNVWDYTSTECMVDGVPMIEWLFAQDFSER